MLVVLLTVSLLCRLLHQLAGECQLRFFGGLRTLRTYICMLLLLQPLEQLITHLLSQVRLQMSFSCASFKLRIY